MGNASLGKNIEIVKVLIDAGAKVTVQHLCNALFNGHDEVSLLLINYIDDINGSCGPTKEFPLMAAVYGRFIFFGNEPEVFEALIDRGADPYQTNRDGNTVVFLVEQFNDSPEAGGKFSEIIPILKQ